MLQLSEKEVEARLRLDNPWWQSGGGIEQEFAAFPRRAYLNDFLRLIYETDVRRAVVLLGPRRVGKTILVYHAIQALIDKENISGRDILYVSLETPIYTGLSLEVLIDRFLRLFQRPEGERLFVFFDEIQYLKQWEVHLKSLVDTYRSIRFVATGSAAAALKTKSAESGAGRFTEFVLPPLTFAEYLRFVGRETDLIETMAETPTQRYTTRDIHGLNNAFIDYLNFGGYPEAVFSDTVRQNPRRFIKSDIIDKVLLRDLPILYGITDIQELNSLFNTLAYNTGQELGIEALSQTSHVAKNTLVKYLDYLEAAFLIRRMRRVDADAAHFKRVTTFKVYLTNPTMRAALFGPVDTNHEAMGHLVESAVFSQWLHNAAFVDSLYYSRWRSGEVDLVSLDLQQHPRFAIEVKWSDQPFDDPKSIKGILEFAKKHRLTRQPLVTTLTKSGVKEMQGIMVEFMPSSLHCYTVARNTLERRQNR
ncbi:MAG: ATP-binding protein [Rhodocyclaceae bacterium]|jgi:predicted AAA+ superfamily ATPase|nr:ATP-binding protein [Rhodocyclaceae bacterium]